MRRAVPVAVLLALIAAAPGAAVKSRFDLANRCLDLGGEPIYFKPTGLGTYLLYLAGVLPFDSDLEESFWGAGLAFVTVAIVAAALTPATRPKPAEELRGLVYGTADLGELDPEDRVWYRSPVLLGSIAVTLSVLLYIPFF